ncbi:hypothetical protein [Nocardioides sp.]|uniref:hypothetical protein n=1 Tax=Nocardioides sp. TaxID=35761 RepID=UPI0031FE7337|nr:hypothetical protein [Nocardioides sp.]
MIFGRRATAASATLLAIVVALPLAGCSDEPGSRQPSDPTVVGSASDSTSTAGVGDGFERLPAGKSDLPVDPGTYLSPDGFEPLLSIDVPEGWTSVHRGSDGFDFGRPDPTSDAPLVAAVLLRPEQSTAADAIAAIRAGTDGRVRDASGRIGSISASGIVVRGGSGELVSSAGFGIALDAATGQVVRILGADVAGVPLLAVVLVPDGDRYAAVLPLAAELLAGITPA